MGVGRAGGRLSQAVSTAAATSSRGIRGVRRSVIGRLGRESRLARSPTIGFSPSFRDPQLPAIPLPLLVTAARRLTRALAGQPFGDPVAHVYRPLVYARSLHEAYLTRFGDGPKRVLMLGMNPGPWGMAQTGVPFGEVAAVRDWMKLTGEVKAPDDPHPKRPVAGLASTRSEVSGRRLWGLMQERFGSPEAFHAEHFVVNYCPLVFMDAGARNLTPDKLPTAERGPLEEACDAHLRSVVKILAPEHLVGVGKWAERRATHALTGVKQPPKISTVLHPSPASPAANRGWAPAAVKQLTASGVWPD